MRSLLKDRKIKNIYNKSLVKLKNHFKKIISFKKSPHAIALGFSVGSFISLFPTFGLAYFIGLGLLIVLPKLNKITLFLGIAFWNPLFLAPIYRYGYKLGNFILGDLPNYTFKFSLNSDIIKLSIRFLLGNIIIATILSITLYFVLFIVLKYMQRNKISGLRP